MAFALKSFFGGYKGYHEIVDNDLSITLTLKNLGKEWEMGKE